MLRTVRLLALAFLAAAGAAFVLSLLRRSRFGAQTATRTGYDPPVLPEGPDAAPARTTIAIDDTPVVAAG